MTVQIIWAHDADNVFICRQLETSQQMTITGAMSHRRSPHVFWILQQSKTIVTIRLCLRHIWPLAILSPRAFFCNVTKMASIGINGAANSDDFCIQ